MAQAMGARVTSRIIGITAALRPSEILRATFSVKFLADQVAGEPASDEAADARGGVGDPGDGAYGFDVEVAHVVEIFGEPEEIEVPSGVGQEFCGYYAPGFFEAEQIEPADFFYGCRIGRGGPGEFFRALLR